MNRRGTLACEKPAEEHELLVCPDTLTALLKSRGLWERKRRRGKHRKRRERRACFGSRVQKDGSHHDWFEGRAGKCVLMVMIDDATSRVLARFYPAETTEAAFDLFGRWVKRYGIPRSIYADRHSIYRDDAITTPAAFGYANGDFNYDGFISGDDYTLIDFNIVAQRSPLSPIPATQPSSALLAYREAANTGRRHRLSFRVYAYRAAQQHREHSGDREFPRKTKGPGG